MAMLSLLLALAATPSLQAQMQGVEQRRNAAIWAGDRATLERIYAPDFQGIAAGGVRVDRAALLDVLARNAGGQYFAQSEILSAREVNGLIFAQGRLRLYATAPRRLISDSFYLHVFRRSADEGWEMIEAAAVPAPDRPLQ